MTQCNECDKEMINIIKSINISLRNDETAIEICADNICIDCAIMSIETAENTLFESIIDTLDGYYPISPTLEERLLKAIKTTMKKINKKK